MTCKIINLLNLIIAFAMFFSISHCHDSECEVKFNKSLQNESEKFINLNEKFLNLQQKDDFSFRSYFENYESYLNFSSEMISNDCKKSVEKLKVANEIEAFKLIDATAKLSSGMLSGNFHQLGDFDECIDVKMEEFQGQYCLAEIQLKLNKNYEFFSRGPYSSEISDVAHIVPKTSSIFWGLCVPSTCSHEDVKIALRDHLINYSEYSSSIKISIRKEACQTAEKNLGRKFDFATILTIGFFFVIIGISFVSSVCEAHGFKNETLMAFSIPRNFKEIISTEVGRNEISVLNGIRVLITLLMVLSHKLMQFYYYSLTNLNHANKVFGSNLSIIFRAVFFSTETFLLLSGFLTAYSILGKLNRKQHVNVFKEIFMRYLRFIPPVMAMIFFYAYIYPHLGSGPRWPELIDYQSEMCRKHYWRNLLMIHNWFGFENICMFNLHHIGTDFIFFIGSVVILVGFNKNQSALLSFVTSVGLFAAFSTFIIIHQENLLTYVFYGASIQDMMRTANIFYVIPFYRCASYAIGMLTALLLRGQRRFTLKHQDLRFGWFLATVGLIFAYGIAFVNHVNHSKFNMAIYSAFAPLLFGCFFAWIIFFREQGHENFITRFFEWKYFKIIANLSYSIYIVQFAVFNYNSSTARHSIEFHLYPHMLDISELAFILTAAILMTIFIELPFSNLRRLIFDKKIIKKEGSS